MTELVYTICTAVALITATVLFVAFALFFIVACLGLCYAIYNGDF